MNEVEKMLGVLDETIGHGLNGIEWQLKRIADALESQTPPPQKLYELNVDAPIQETPTEEM